MLILLASLAVLLVLGIPIAYAIGLSSVLFFALNHPDLVQILPQRMFAGFNSYTLIALPLFILMGFLMNEAGITAKPTRVKIEIKKCFIVLRGLIVTR